jgi:hypothetical protein
VSAVSKGVPETGEQVKGVFEWDRDIRYSGTVERTALIVVHVTGQPDDTPTPDRVGMDSPLARYWQSNPCRDGATSADRRRSRVPWAGPLEDRRKRYGCVVDPCVSGRNRWDLALSSMDELRPRSVNQTARRRAAASGTSDSRLSTARASAIRAKGQ